MVKFFYNSVTVKMSKRIEIADVVEDDGENRQYFCSRQMHSWMSSLLWSLKHWFLIKFKFLNFASPARTEQNQVCFQIKK